jgi:hypothetical protein
LYVGDWDLSGLWMSEGDLPARLVRYGGGHVILKRVVLTEGQERGLPSFPANDKRTDPRYRRYVGRYGQQCWEVDALDPNALRECVRQGIEAEIEPEAWERCKNTERAEQHSLRTIMRNWNGKPAGLV